MKDVLHRLSVPLLAVLLAAAPYVVSAETVVLTTLQWPPYVGDKLPQQGGSAAVVRAAFQAVGIEVKLEFMPWPRALKLGAEAKGYAGYFPAYFSEERSRDSLISEQIGSSPLGMARLRSHSISWRTLDELAPYRIGVVDGYLNTADFDRRRADGRLHVDLAPSDESNLMKVAVKRVDLAVVDHHVFDHLIRNSAPLGQYASSLVFDGPLLEDKPLYVYFQRTPQGERLRALFNQGLSTIDVSETFGKATAGQP